MMEQVERDVTDFKQTEANPFTRAKIDFVSGHMENFPLGELVIKECGLKGLFIFFSITNSNF